MTESEPARFIPNLTAAMDARGMDATGLASACKLSPTHIRHFLAGRYAPAPLVLARIARVLQVPVDWLGTGTGDVPEISRARPAPGEETDRDRT